LNADAILADEVSLPPISTIIRAPYGWARGLWIVNPDKHPAMRIQRFDPVHAATVDQHRLDPENDCALMFSPKAARRLGHATVTVITEPVPLHWRKSGIVRF